MTRRPALTLMEVLITMLIMAVGMLALLVLFPVGAMSMAQALEDDRCASAASMAEHHAIAMNVRTDPLVLTAFATTGSALPPGYMGPSYPVFVDPYAVLNGLTQLSSVTSSGQGIVGPSSVIQRTTVSYAPTSQLIDRWFSLPNDTTFTSAGIPDLSSGFVDRGREYTWAYMVNSSKRGFRKRSMSLLSFTANGQPRSLTQETTYAATGLQGTNTITLGTVAGQTFKRGTWLLDMTPVGTALIPAAQFYRVINVSANGNGTTTMDVQSNLANPVSQVVVMDNVSEVFTKGLSWKP